MISWWEVLKASKGLPVSDFYAAMWGKQIAGKYTITELEGPLPLTFNADGTALIDYRIYGNTVQDGTPTPENPIMPSGCGERTGNVMPAGEQKTVVSNGVTFSSDGKGKYTINGTATTDASARFNLLSAFTTPISVSKGGQGTLSFFNTSSDINVSFVFYNGTTKVDDWRLYQIRRTATEYTTIGNKYVDSVIITVSSAVTVDMTITPEFTNDGIIPSEFEPYGYKIPISSANTTTPVYLGEVETTRKIKKLVLTGEKGYTWNKSATRNYSWYLYPSEIGTIEHTPFYCSHGETVTSASDYAYGKVFCDNTINLGIFDSSINSSAKINAYLAQQYAVGTPVTIWYVLAKPETAVVNEPLMKIGDHADTISMEQADVSIPTNKGSTTLDVDTTIKPSNVYIKYKS